MIIDTLSNAEKYFCVHPLFAKAYAYIRSIDLNTIEEGSYEVSEGIRAIVFDRYGNSLGESISKFECHNAHIDIQVCINGKEKIGWKPREGCIVEKSKYDPVNDVAFYGDVPDTYFQLTQNQFVILFPEDVHAPMIGDEKIKKIVIKVKIQ